MFSPRRTYPPVEEDPWQKMLDELKEDPNAPQPIRLKSEAYPRYEPVLPVNPKRYLSYDRKLIGLEKALTFSTRLESTTQVFVHGHDLFMSRMMPDNGFDVLDEDFNHLALFAAIAVLVVIDFVLMQVQKKYNVKKNFLTR